MKPPLGTGVPPIFSETHAATIVDAAMQYPDADGLIVEIPPHMLVCVRIRNGIVDRWVVEGPVAPGELEDRWNSLVDSGFDYRALTMHVDRVVPLKSGRDH